MMKKAKPADSYFALIEERLSAGYEGMFREPGGALKYPFLTPGSDQYADVLWDWDSWLSDIALRQILAKSGHGGARDQARPYEQGCVLNFLEFGGMDGWIPILSGRDGPVKPPHIYEQNMHKPCLAQHAAFLTENDGGDAEWLRSRFCFLQTFLNNYRNINFGMFKIIFFPVKNCPGFKKRCPTLLDIINYILWSFNIKKSILLACERGLW
jgi:putative isomerase